MNKDALITLTLTWNDYELISGHFFPIGQKSPLSDVLLRQMRYIEGDSVNEDDKDCPRIFLERNKQFCLEELGTPEEYYEDELERST